MEIETRGLESQAEKLKDSLLNSLQNHSSIDGKVSMMKIICDEEIEAQLTIFVCQQLIDEFISAATLPLVIVPAKNEISPTYLAVMLKAFYLACEEGSRFLNTTPGELRESFIRQSQRALDGKSAEEIISIIHGDLASRKI